MECPLFKGECHAVGLKIDELAALVHPRDGHRKVFAMIEAYLDESGIHRGANVCVIAGYLGERDSWADLEAGWRKALSDAGVPLEDFHTTDFLPTHNYRGLLLELATVIQSCEIRPVSFGIIVSDFFSLNEKQRRFITGAVLKGTKLITSGCPSKPYFTPFQSCVKRVASYTPPEGKAHFFFGLDRGFAKYAMALYGLIKNGAHHPYSRSE